ncbi:MAG: (E)-4-hydroxy-3-methylbut-2-enyl-diphosphate synthase [Candidatus Kapabacteria bacterium]|nr:(E)-4-hydroxy-3-methylbut-2-enyl-diphosphate synthase [Candidatus Kapabacteria bacterium]
MNPYCTSLTEYSRFVTRVVHIGDVALGGTNPIRVQSMTTTNTMDTLATVEQSVRMIESGCELVRITAPSKKDAENLANIKHELRARGYTTPLVADIHFTPNAAEIAARIVEKVRVNPGNYADKKKFENIDYTDASYNEELERIREKFTPLVRICKEYGTAMRIGTNHGSLSDRIMSRYGDTPLGMVESAMEFLRICEDENFYNIVISMKASNTQVMVQAYRLLVATMMQNNMNYPLHLGVTEAGDGEDGRIKSAVGIGTLLEDGLGDTVRVSLTEDPEFEIPVAKAVVRPYDERRAAQLPIEPVRVLTHDPYSYERRHSTAAGNIGAKNVPRVVCDMRHLAIDSPVKLFRIGYNYSVPLDKWNIADTACDYVYAGGQHIPFEIPGTLGIIQDYATWDSSKERHYPLYPVTDYLNATRSHSELNFVLCTIHSLTDDVLQRLTADPTVCIVITSRNPHTMAELRRAGMMLKEYGCTAPILYQVAAGDGTHDDTRLSLATTFGGLLLDGYGDGVWATHHDDTSHKFINETLFGILQATRTRISKTEYISCPSCGRTLFDLQETTAKIRARTSHLKGVKIGIMGCIVNGPGEMADADYGYVGSGPGKITLYKGKEVVQKSIAAESAVDELIALIKDGGDWVDVE